MKNLYTFVLAVSAAASFASSGIIVHYQPGTSPNTLANQAGVKFVDKSPFYEFALFSVPDFLSPVAVEAQLRATRGVIWAEDNADTDNPENGRSFASDQGKGGATIASIYSANAVVVANRGSANRLGFQRTSFAPTDRRIRVAIFDTGISQYHRWLTQRTIASFNVTGSKTAVDQPDRIDSSGNGRYDEAAGHGTMVSSIIGTFAPYADLITIKVSDSDGMSNAWSLVKAFTYAAHSGCELINMSLGSSDRIVAMSDMLDFAEQQGMTVVAAAGNDGVRGLRYPAQISKVIAVTGVNSNDIKSPFSNWDGHADFCAPAEDIIADYWNGGMAKWSGTSFAAPFVTGMVADALRSRPRMTPNQLKDWLDGRGVNVDSLNPQYDGEIGVRISYSALR